MKTWLQIFPSAILFIASGLVLTLLFACKDKNRIHPDPVTLLWDFNSGTEGWEGDFSEYPVGEEANYELLFEHDTLPAPLDQNQRALKLSGFNHNSDLFMFVKRKITGLDPVTVYYITFNVEFASNEPGPSDESEASHSGLIHIAAGASAIEPVKVMGDDNTYIMNINKCNGNADGEDMIVLGNFSNDTGQPVYALKTLENDQPFHCLTNEEGELWVIIGIDSALDAATAIYYNAITVNLF
jgi:hypothetical protein